MSDAASSSAPGAAAGIAVPEGFVAGNAFDKYRSGNPIHRWMMRRFLADARDLLALARPRRILEIGCGPGDLAAELLGPCPAGGDAAPAYIGIDLSAEEIAVARDRSPGRDFRVASAASLPFDDGAFDTVIACEVFEHLDDPERAMDEAARVCSGRLLLSVPWEPVWRILNVARGKYITRLGNTPGHLQHFSRGAIRRLVSRRFDVLQVRRPLPWTMLLAEARGRAAE